MVPSLGRLRGIHLSHRWMVSDCFIEPLRMVGVSRDKRSGWEADEGVSFTETSPFTLSPVWATKDSPVQIGVYCHAAP